MTEWNITALYADGGTAKRCLLRQLSRGRTELKVLPPLQPEGEDAGIPEIGSEEWVDWLRPAVDNGPGSWAVALPSRDVLMRVFNLPTVDPDEVAGMVELQIDKVSPFPIEDMAVSYELLHKEEDASVVLVAAAPLSNVETWGELCGGKVHEPLHIDLDLSVRWQQLRDAGIVEMSGRHVFILLSDAEVSLIVTDNGEPCLLSYLCDRDELSSDELMVELQYSLTVLDAQNNSEVLSRLTVCGPSEQASELLDDLSELGAGMSDVLDSAETLPPLEETLVQRAAVQGAGHLNLAPEEWVEATDMRRMKRSMLQVSSVVAGIWILLIGVFLTYAAIQEKRLARVVTHVEELRAEVKVFSELQGKAETLERYADRTHSALESLREIVQLLPAGIELTQFAYKKNVDVDLRGFAPSDSPINKFYSELETSGLFTKIKPGKTQTKTKRGISKTEFQATAYLPGGEEE